MSLHSKVVHHATVWLHTMPSSAVQKNYTHAIFFHSATHSKPYKCCGVNGEQLLSMCLSDPLYLSNVEKCRSQPCGSFHTIHIKTQHNTSKIIIHWLFYTFTPGSAIESGGFMLKYWCVFSMYFHVRCIALLLLNINSLLVILYWLDNSWYRKQDANA